MNNENETTVMRFDNGFSFVKLNSPEAKDFEENAMGHCVGRSSYDNKTIFSLRDKNNNPHLTIEYNEDNKEIYQIKGKGNSSPKSEYMDMLGDFFTELQPKRISDVDNIITKGGKYYVGMDAINSIPEGEKKRVVNIREAYVISESRRYYVGEEAIKAIPVDDKIRELHNVSYALSENRISKREQINKLHNVNYVISENRKYYIGIDAINSIPKRERIQKAEIIDDYVISKSGRYYVGADAISSIPAGLEIKEVNIRDAYAISKSRRYYVGEDAIKAIPKSEQIKELHNVNYALSENGKLYLGEDAILNIPDSEKLKTANINGCKNITHWNHDVSGDFNAFDSSLETIGENVEISGKTDITGTPLERKLQHQQEPEESHGMRR